MGSNSNKNLLHFSSVKLLADTFSNWFLKFDTENMKNYRPISLYIQTYRNVSSKVYRRTLITQWLQWQLSVCSRKMGGAFLIWKNPIYMPFFFEACYFMPFMLKLILLHCCFMHQCPLVKVDHLNLIPFQDKMMVK